MLLGCEDLLPKVIAGITSIEDSDQEIFVLSIQHRKPAPASVINPFAHYPDFGAQLWSSEFEDKIMCILATQSICYSKSHIWVTGVVVLKVITSVGFQICQFSQDLQYPSGDLNSTSPYFLVLFSYYVAYFISCDWYIFSLDEYIQESTHEFDNIPLFPLCFQMCLIESHH